MGDIPARIAALGQAPSASPEQLERLRAILARPEFQAGEGGARLEDLLAPLRNAILSFLLNLVRGVAPGVQGADDLWRVLGAAAAVLVSLAALVAFVRIARGSMAAEAELRRTELRRAPTAEEELALARRYAAAGELRRAIHHHYVAVLRRLDERGALRFDASMTNREHHGRAAGSPPVAATLEPLVAAFDRLWYGQASCSPAEYEAFSALAARAWQAG